MMITAILNISMLALSFLASGTSESLDDLRWKNRIVIVSPGDNPAEFSKQLSELTANAAELEDRHMLVFSVKDDFLLEARSGEKIPFDAQTGNKYQLKERVFEVILIGKDGGVKLRENSFVEQEKIFALIDTMPMRQAEMRRQ